MGFRDVDKHCSFWVTSSHRFIVFRIVNLELGQFGLFARSVYWPLCANHESAAGVKPVTFAFQFAIHDDNFD